MLQSFKGRGTRKRLENSCSSVDNCCARLENSVGRDVGTVGNWKRNDVRGPYQYKG